MNKTRMVTKRIVTWFLCFALMVAILPLYSMKAHAEDGIPCPHCYKGMVCINHYGHSNCTRYKCNNPCKPLFNDAFCNAHSDEYHGFPFFEETCYFCEGTGIVKDGPNEPPHTHNFKYTHISKDGKDWHQGECSVEGCSEKSELQLCDTNGYNLSCSVCGVQHTHSFTYEHYLQVVHCHIGRCIYEGCDADPPQGSWWQECDTDGPTGECSYCGYSAHTHVKGTYHEAVAASCTTVGNTEYWDCECGKMIGADGKRLTDVVIAALGHKVTSEVPDFCSVCGPIVTFTIIDGNLKGNNKEEYTNLIDGNIYTKWCCVVNQTAYVVIEASEPINIVGYTITTGADAATYTNRNPKSWVLFGCNDYDAEKKSGTWTVIDTVTDGNMPTTNVTPKSFDVVTEGEYKYYKWNITSQVSGVTLQVSEFLLTYKSTYCEKGRHFFVSTVKEGLEGQCKERETCTIAGKYYKHCYYCDVLSTETFEVPATEKHNFVDSLCSMCNMFLPTFTIIEGNPAGYNNEEYANLLDGKTDTKWCCNISGEAYVIIGVSAPINVTGYTITTGGDTSIYKDRNPKSWVLFGCNDYDAEKKTGSWTEIDTVSDGDMPTSNSTSKSFDVTAKGAYKYYKWSIKSLKGGTTLQVSEFSLSYSSARCDKGIHDFSLNPEVCRACGTYKDSIGAKLAGYSLSLHDNIGVDFYMELADKVIKDEDAKFVFKISDGSFEEIPVREAKLTEVNGKTYYVFECYVAAKQMTDTIKAKIVLGDDTEGTEYQFTVQDYAKYILEHESEYEEVLPLVKAMLSYGASAQNYFSYNTDKLADTILAEADRNVALSAPELTGYNYSVPKEADTVSFLGTSLVLESEVGLKCYFYTVADLQYSNVTVKLGDKVLDESDFIIGKSGAAQYIMVTGLAPSDYEKLFTITVHDFTVQNVSVYGYMAQAFKMMGDSDKLTDVLKNMYAYGEVYKKCYK